jgi:hypothetical protein
MPANGDHARTPEGVFGAELRYYRERAGLSQMELAALVNAYPGWFTPWPDYEEQATTLRWYEPLVVPGVFQTEDYARAVLRTRVGDTDEEIDEIVAARIARQSIFSKEKPPTVWAVLDEGVLRRPVGGKHIMRAQLNRLAEAARLPNVVIQIIPADTGAHEGCGVERSSSPRSKIIHLWRIKTQQFRGR